MSAHPTPRHLADVLAAAAAPARPGELDGEERVMVAYRAAHPARAPQPRRRSMLKTILAKIASAKVAAACAAAAAAGAGGIAAATTAGGLPYPFHVGPAVSPSPQALRPRPSDVQAGHPYPVPSRAALMDHRSRCREWQSKDREQRQRSLDEPAFRDLINSAGGRDWEKVDGYCRNLLNTWPSDAPSDRPSDRPDGSPGPRPTGPPGPRPSR